MTRRKSKVLRVSLITVCTLMLAWSSLSKDWAYAATFAAGAAMGTAMLVERMARFANPLAVCMIGISIVGPLGQEVPRIVGWVLIAMSPLSALIDHVMRARGKSLFPDAHSGSL